MKPSSTGSTGPDFPCTHLLPHMLFACASCLHAKWADCRYIHTTWIYPGAGSSSCPTLLREHQPQLAATPTAQQPSTASVPAGSLLQINLILYLILQLLSNVSIFLISKTGKLQIWPLPSKSNGQCACKNTGRYLLTTFLSFINFLYKVLFNNHAN